MRVNCFNLKKIILNITLYKLQSLILNKYLHFYLGASLLFICYNILIYINYKVFIFLLKNSIKKVNIILFILIPPSQ